jgi:hypothetical protein
MYINYWLDRAMAVVENEVILVKQSSTTQGWFDKMPPTIPAIYPGKKYLGYSDFSPKIGLAHHLRLTRWGIEGVLKVPRKFHRYPFYVLYDKVQQPNEPFWVVFQNK